MATNRRNRKIAPALAASIAAVNAAAQAPATDAAGTAVMEPPPAPTPVVPPSAEVQEQEKKDQVAAGVDPAAVQVLETLKKSGKHIKDSSISKAERKAVKASAMDILVGVGLGERSGGHGPIVRQVMVVGLKDMLKVNVVRKDMITADNLLKLLKLDTFETAAPAHLTSYLTGLKDDVSENTLETRKDNAEKAKKWVNGGMFKHYATAMEAVIALGREVHFTTDTGVISMPLDRALGVAFGRNITAAELMKAEKSVHKPAKPTKS